MYLIPSAMMLGAPISTGQWLFWNLLPVTIGNLVAGTVLTGMALYATYPAVIAPVVSVANAQAPAQSEQQAAFAAAAGLQ
jgi:hypothetical protein